MATSNTKTIELTYLRPTASCTQISADLVAEIIMAQALHRLDRRVMGTGGSSAIPSISISWRATGDFTVSFYYQPRS